MAQRAQTLIERVTAMVGNASLERRWSLLGKTVELLQKGGARPIQWVPRPLDEFRIETSEGAFTAMDFQNIEWSDETDAYGAGVAAHYEHPALEVVVLTCAFHDAPGHLRTMTLLNPSSAEVVVTSVAPDLAFFGHQGVTVEKRTLAAPGAFEGWTLAREQQDFTIAGQGLILGHEEIQGFALESGPEQTCIPVFRSELRLAPREKVSVPAMFLATFTGSPEVAAADACRALLTQCQAQRKAQCTRSSLT